MHQYNRKRGPKAAAPGDPAACLLCHSRKVATLAAWLPNKLAKAEGAKAQVYYLCGPCLKDQPATVRKVDEAMMAKVRSARNN